MKILLVEKDARTVRLLQDYCWASGYELSVAADIAMALGQIEAVAPDLVFLDIGIACGQDWKLLKAVRANSRAAVILLAVVEDLGEVYQGLTLGGDDYLAKPFDEAELDARIRALLVTLRLAPDAGKRRCRPPREFDDTLVARRVT